ASASVRPPSPLDRLAERRRGISPCMDRSQLRAGDADRRQVADELQRHYVEGRLTSDELQERVRQAMAARTFGELDALLRDLPAQPAAPPTPPAVEARVAEQPAASAPAGPVVPPDVRANAVSYALVMLLLVAIWLFT